MGWPFSKFVLFLLPAGLLLATPAGAETSIGTVVSIEENRFVFLEEQTQGKELTPRKFQVLFVPATKRGRFSSGPSFPHCVRTGKTIHIFGHFDADKNVFLAREIRGVPGRGKYHDPTGARARLGRCRNHQGGP